MRKSYLIPLILVLICSVAGCKGESFADNSDTDKTGNRLFIPEGYQAQLDEMDLKEIATKPYFQSPFIAIAQDKNGRQYAVIFNKGGEVRKEELPLGYDEIIKQLESQGQNISLSNAPSLDNLHLFVINNKLVWNFNNLYWDAEGEEVSNPFQ
ncbi:hypothetical protein [Paenibacillus jiagnxiensis]|uniref:hypothetical protein n=1 Tax=Paenibacillus jiagnxiensis TaxID=3228926 RepID=UPI0033ADC5DE